MEFEQQKPITDEYRRGWERIYAQREAWKCPRLSEVNTDGDGACLTPELIRKTLAKWKIKMGHEEYPNGCPILSEGPQKDDL